MTTDIYGIIKSRRSVRCFKDERIPNKSIQIMLSAGAAAPSGKNCQPWKFCVIKEKTIIDEMANAMLYSKFISEAKVVIGVFYDKKHGYDDRKDYLSIGAAIQNIMLCAHSMNIGTCCICESIDISGEIIGKYYMTDELIPVSLIAVGYKKYFQQHPSKRPLDEIYIKHLPKSNASYADMKKDGKNEAHNT